MAISKENVRVMITMPLVLKEQLELKADKENRSLSNHIVTLIQSKEMNEHGETR